MPISYLIDISQLYKKVKNIFSLNKNKKKTYYNEKAICKTYGTEIFYATLSTIFYKIVILHLVQLEVQLFNQELRKLCRSVSIILLNMFLNLL